MPLPASHDAYLQLRDEAAWRALDAGKFAMFAYRAMADSFVKISMYGAYWNRHLHTVASQSHEGALAVM